MRLPVDILWIWGVAHSPVLTVKLWAKDGGLWLPTAVAALTFAGIKVFQNSEKKYNTNKHHKRLLRRVEGEVQYQKVMRWLHTWIVLTWQSLTHSGR